MTQTIASHLQSPSDASFKPEQRLVGTADTFAERLGEMFNHGAVVSMISIGHQLEIFDRMAGMGPSRSDEIATATQLNERYVREWLAVMTTGGIIEYDASTQQYRLPNHHAACLTRSASPGNMAVTSQFIPLIGKMESHLISSFRSGEGLHYCD